MSHFHIYPFRCQICSHRFKAFRLFRRYVKHSVDRRQFERIETNLPAVFSFPGKQGEGRVIDLSVAGCRLESDAQLKLETILTLEIQGTRWSSGHLCRRHRKQFKSFLHGTSIPAIFR